MSYLIRFCIIVLLVISTPLQAQKYVVKGKVVNQADQTPVAYAAISVLKHDTSLITGTISDSIGQFQLSGIKEDSILIKIQCLGYKTLILQRAIPENGKLLDIQIIPLEWDDTLLPSVIIQGGKPNTLVQIDKQVIDARQFESAAGGTGLDVLKNLASVTVNIEGNISYRGSEEFIVLLNNKPTNRTPAEVLSQIPANQIETIEILTSPAAKYDAEGKAGIIHILTKKEFAHGLGVQANGMFGGTNPLRTGGDFLFQYSNEKLQFYVNGNYRRYDFDGYRYGETRTIVADTITYLYSEGIRNYIEYNYAGAAGFSYHLNKHTMWNIALYGGFKESDRDAQLHYQEYYNVTAAPVLFETDFGDPKSLFFNQNLFVRTGEFYTLHTDYSHTYRNDGNIHLLMLYESSVLGGPLTQKETDDVSFAVLSNARSDETNPLNGWRLQADYALPLPNNNSVEAGCQLRLLQHNGNFLFERQDLSSDIWYIDSTFTNTIQLHQDIYAAYAQWNGKKEMFTYNVGIRAEYTDRSLEHSLAYEPYLYSKLDFFPSIQGLWQLNNDQKYKLSYNRRIDRPTTRLMAPFKNHRHTESIEVGDPDLLPEITDIAELVYTKSTKAITLTSTAYFNYVQNKIFRLNDVYNRYTLIRTYTNAGNATSLGLEVAADVRITPWWKIYLAGNVYAFHVKGIVNSESVDKKSFNQTVKGNTTITIAKQTTLQWDANYISETVTAIGTDGDLFLSNVQAKYTFWNNNAYVGCKLQNIFNTNNQLFVTEGNNFYSAIEFIKYDRGILLQCGMNLNANSKKSKIIKTEYGEKDF